MIEAIYISNNYQALKSNQLILWGAGRIGKKLIMILKHMGIKIGAVCDNNKNLWNSSIDGVPIISPTELSEITKKHSTIVMVSLRLNNYSELLEQFEKLGVKQYVPFEELRQLLFLYKHMEPLIDEDGNEVNTYIKEMHGDTLLDADLLDLDYILQRKISFDETISKLSPPYPALLCTPFEADLEKLKVILSGKMKSFDFDHMPTSFDPNILKFCNINAKMIMAVRDPIAQNLSFVERMFKHKSVLEEAYFLKLSEKYSLDENSTYQKIFDAWMEEICYTNKKQEDNFVLKTMKIPRHIQGFMQDFCKCVLDVIHHPFDKEKGYSVIKGENIELFVYQYEKFDSVLSNLEDWLDIKIKDSNSFVPSNFNDAANIKFSQEYFDKCYNEPYVKHFYSEEDIEKFKNRWRGNIRKDGE